MIFVVILAANIKWRQNCKEYATRVYKVSKILRLLGHVDGRQCRPSMSAHCLGYQWLQLSPPKNKSTIDTDIDIDNKSAW